ncbi:TPA: hypothetical protein JI095_00600 [Acinetobacter baumannii]|nr:hypothetical protein [Acinetobacter baumannii]
MDKKALQEQFEAIAIQNCWNINKYPAGWDGHGDDEYADDFVSGAWWGFLHQQAKVEELKASHHGEVIGHEVHFKKIKKERDELQTLYIQQGINMLKLQKRVDAALKLIESWNEIAFDKTTHWTEGYEEGCYHCAAQLEQALKGEG